MLGGIDVAAGVAAVKKGIEIAKSIKTAIDTLKEFRNCMRGEGAVIAALKPLEEHTDRLISLLERLNQREYKEELEGSMNLVAEQIQKTQTEINDMQGQDFSAKFSRFFSKDSNLGKITSLFGKLTRDITEILGPSIGAQGLANDERIEHKVEDVGQRVDQAATASEARDNAAHAEHQAILDVIQQELLVRQNQQRDTVVVMAEGSVAEVVRNIGRDLRVADRVFTQGASQEDLVNQAQAAAEQNALLKDLLEFESGLPQNALDTTVISKGAKAGVVENIRVRAGGGEIEMKPAASQGQGKPSRAGMYAQQNNNAQLHDGGPEQGEKEKRNNNDGQPPRKRT